MAHFIKLTPKSINYPNTNKIWINVNQIITISYHNSGSLIKTTGISNGYSETIVVEEEPNYILDLIDNRPPKEKTW